ncbi:DDE-type integrase/transposase/recombinase [Streptomyces sp. NPDC002928]|uniref:DDE-type integrase/transposase/recombinase n=1 Tax=Streptomyces sp. NPDC002928 TaxID=3154440 RepID=UPI00339E3DBE
MLNQAGHATQASCLVVDALRMATARGGLKEGCITHSDRGSEYTSREHRALIQELGLRQSMGRTGSCYDNAVDESFFGLLKAEIGTTVWESHEAARADVFHFIEVEYNRTRLPWRRKTSPPQRKHPLSRYRVELQTARRAGSLRGHDHSRQSSATPKPLHRP